MTTLFQPTQSRQAYPSTFKSVYYRTVDDVVLRDSQIEEISDQEIMLKVDACGICGTDINAILRGSDTYQQIGHEIAGRIVNADGQVTTRQVVLESSSACGRCSACRNGWQAFCTSIKSFFSRSYFGLAEEMPAPEISAVEYGDMEPDVACLSEPLGVAIDLCEVAEIGPHSVVLVIGIGPIGLMAVRLAKLAGASKIYASTFTGREKRNSLALEFGADELLFEDENPLSQRRLDPPPNRILSTAPPSSIRDCVRPAAMGAIVVYIGVGHEQTNQIHLPANEFHFKKLQLRSSYASPALRTPLALHLLRSGRVNGSRLISHRFPLTEAKEAIRTACFDKNDAIKVVVLPNF